MAALAAWDADEAQGLATYGAVATWDVTGVADFSYLLYGRTSFDEDLSDWSTSDVTEMEYSRTAIFEPRSVLAPADQELTVRTSLAGSVPWRRSFQLAARLGYG